MGRKESVKDWLNKQINDAETASIEFHHKKQMTESAYVEGWKDACLSMLKRMSQDTDTPKPATVDAKEVKPDH